MVSQGVPVREVVKRLGVSRARVYKLIERGTLRAVSRDGQPRPNGKFGEGGMLIDPDDVEREAAARGR